jgi:hypothetical protein
MSQSTDQLRSQLGRLADTVIVPIELADQARQRARRDRTRLVTIVALVVTLAAVGTVVALRNFVQPRSLPAATYQMPFGLRPPDGTRQLGPVFVQNDYAQTTVFLVTGDPYAVFRDLAAQLRRAGFGSSGNPIVCGSDSTTGAESWTCFAGGERRTGRDEMVSMSMVVSVHGGPYQAELVIATVSAPLGPNDSVSTDLGPIFEVPAGPAPVQPEQYQPGATAGPGPHDPTGDAGRFFRYTYGVSAVVPPFHLACGATAGFMSVQSTAGSPVAAARDYISQLASQGLRMTERNATWTVLKGDTNIGTITVSRGRDDTGYLLLEYCER